MTRTQKLLAEIAAGNRRIDSMGGVQRLASTGEWVTDTTWRSDVVMRVRIALIPLHANNLLSQGANNGQV